LLSDLRAKQKSEIPRSKSKISNFQTVTPETRNLTFPPITAHSSFDCSPSLRATFERSATVSPHGTKDLIDSPLAATRNTDREQAAFFALH